MAITKTISNVTRGADLLKPQLNITYLAAATVSVVVLMFVWKMGNYVFDKGGRMVQGNVPGMNTPAFAQALGIE
jgi:hypothetical protein